MMRLTQPTTRLRPRAIRNFGVRAAPFRGSSPVGAALTPASTVGCARPEPPSKSRYESKLETCSLAPSKFWLVSNRYGDQGDYQ